MNNVAKAGHNSGLDPSQERAFIREFAAIKEAESDMAEAKGVMSGIYKRLENAGFEKPDIKWAKDLEKKNVSEVVATLKRRLAIAVIMGHAISRQVEMFDKDRTPLEDAAYLEGLGAGRLRRQNANPYGMETTAGQSWQKGFNEGSAEANAALAEAMSGDIIKAGDETPETKTDGEAEGDTDGDGKTEEATAEEAKVSAASNADDDWERAAPEKKSPSKAKSKAASPLH